MRKPFEGNFVITQPFGNAHFAKDAQGNPINPYAKFGMLGHNGIDYGLPCETKLVAAISGIVREVASDPTGYGLYIKIENDAEGCLVAHLTKQDVVVGSRVDEGQHIGWSGTTGNSTGCHLHFGYYRMPRDRQNGYAGYIDPTPYFESVIIPPTDTMDDDHKRGLQVLEDNRLKRPQGPEGNWEAYARALVGEDEQFPKLTTDLVNANKALQDCRENSNLPSHGPEDLTVQQLFALLFKKLFPTPPPK